MRFRAYEWDTLNIDHIARHGVEPREAEAACRGESTVVLRGREGRYLVYGRTGTGRYLFIVLHSLGGGVGRIITARDMTQRERQLYHRRR